MWRRSAAMLHGGDLSCCACNNVTLQRGPATSAAHVDQLLIVGLGGSWQGSSSPVRSDLEFVLRLKVKRKHVIEAARSLPRTPPIQPAFESHHHDEEASSYGTKVSRGTRAGMRRCGT